MKEKQRPIWWAIKEKAKNPYLSGGLGLVCLVLIAAGIWTYKAKQPKQPQTDNTVAAERLDAWWVKQYFGESVCSKPNCEPGADPDHDNLTNKQEFFYHSNPLVPDTNQNGLNDGEDVAQGFDPSRPGKTTFDQVVSENMILGESVLFGSTLENMVSEANDISKVKIDLVPDSELKVTYATTNEAYNGYLQSFQEKVAKYFPGDQLESLANLVEKGNREEVVVVATKSQGLVKELKGITVPIRFLSFHKYYIAFFELLPQVLQQPTAGSVDEDAWYDKAQAFLAVQQKIAFEKDLLSKILSDEPKQK